MAYSQKLLLQKHLCIHLRRELARTKDVLDEGIDRLQNIDPEYGLSDEHSDTYGNALLALSNYIQVLEMSVNALDWKAQQELEDQAAQATKAPKDNELWDRVKSLLKNLQRSV